MTETTIAEIEREIREVDQLFRSFDDLLTRVKDEDPDLVEMTAVSTVIHSFYNGLENIFSRIAKAIDDLVPAGVRRETAEDLAESSAAARKSLPVSPGVPASIHGPEILALKGLNRKARGWRREA